MYLADCSLINAMCVYLLFFVISWSCFVFICCSLLFYCFVRIVLCFGFIIVVSWLCVSFLHVLMCLLRLSDALQFLLVCYGCAISVFLFLLLLLFVQLLIVFYFLSCAFLFLFLLFVPIRFEGWNCEVDIAASVEVENIYACAAMMVEVDGLGGHDHERLYKLKTLGKNRSKHEEKHKNKKTRKNTGKGKHRQETQWRTTKTITNKKRGLNIRITQETNKSKHEKINKQM